MQIGDLVTWKIDVIHGDKLQYGVIIGHARKVGKSIDLLWVKFLNGNRSHRKKTLCNIQHLVLVEDIK